MKTFYISFLLGAVLLSGISLSNRTNDASGFYLALLVDVIILAWVLRKKAMRAAKRAANGLPSVSISITINPKQDKVEGPKHH
ncbi:hypothetical protein [Burkholderia cepacia]|uniref:hypothetical protein n=1 Tax=Burkholderia cepacia TaxID=292 RepID=UPI000F5A61D1|nr:hypothetical protein [Burkholderia cepacia]RQT46831.1 hypothetical protein DF050_27135 [Burkholderia cepacia]